MSLCRCTVPILIGLARAMGRFTYADPPLLSRLFPRPESPSVKNQKGGLNQPVAVTTVTLKRSLSYGNNPQLVIDGRPSNLLMEHENSLPTKGLSFHSYMPIPNDPATYFFNKYGSSFNQFPQMRCNESPVKKAGLQFSVVHLQSVLAKAKKLLTKEMLEFLDEEAQEVCKFSIFSS